MPRCPKCGSESVENYDYSGTLALRCNACGYDEGIEFYQGIFSKNSQKAKGDYSPYKTGGRNRASKKIL